MVQSFEFNLTPTERFQKFPEDITGATTACLLKVDHNYADFE